MELSVFADQDNSQFWLLARLDNLGKGASGAAVQNMNIALGLDEMMGLSTGV
jgi:N-acetyl-gamma-glutamyl-phosphate reductase